MSLERARADWIRFSTGGGFEVDLTFETPSGSVTKTVQGIGMKHHLSVDSEGVNVNQLNAHITVSENELIDAGYPVRNGSDIVDLKDHKLRYADSTGVEKEYLIKQTYPDETVGMITCILGEYGSS